MPAESTSNSVGVPRNCGTGGACTIPSIPTCSLESNADIDVSSSLDSTNSDTPPFFAARSDAICR